MSRSCEASWKPAPRVVQRLQHLQPPLRLRRDLLLRRQRQQRIGAQLRAADAAAQLVELGQAEHVGAVHDQRVGVRDVEPGLHDRGRQQDVVLAVVERRHDVLDHGRRHLAVGDRDPHLRHVLVEEILDTGEILDPRHDVERLPAAIALAQQRLADHQGSKRRDEGAHRQAVDRRRGDDRELAHAGQRQLQRARDRRRGQRQHVDLGAQLLEPLLLGDAEMLLLVDDQQAEILELDRLAEQRVGADDDVDAAVGEPFLVLSSSSLVETSREACATLTGKPLKRSVKVLRMLPRQQRGRHHDRDLLALRAPRRRPRAAPPRSCRSRRRRRSAGPSGGRSRGPSGSN